MWNVPHAYRRNVERVNGEIVTSVRLSDELVQVSIGSAVVGFVESAGPVFVALYGERYSLAVEVAQSLAFDVAAAGLLAHARVVSNLSEELAMPAPKQIAPAKPKHSSRVA